jgi:hypothetical protein
MPKIEQQRPLGGALGNALDISQEIDVFIVLDRAP